MSAELLQSDFHHQCDYTTLRSCDCSTTNSVENDHDSDPEPPMAKMPTNIKKQRPFFLSIWDLVADYSINSTVHGVRYVFEQRRHWSERLWWTLAFGLSVYGCGQLIQTVYEKWHQTPVIVTFAEKTTPVWEIPFPAVTICPETKTRTQLVNYTYMYHMVNEGAEVGQNYSELQFEQFKVLLQLCGTGGWNASLNGECTVDIMRSIKTIAPRFTSIVFKCFFRHKMMPCTQLFRGVMTDEGLCYTFNAVDMKDMYRDSINADFLVENHMPSTDNDSNVHMTAPLKSHSNDETFPYPFRVFGSGKRAGLRMMMSLDTRDFDFLCRNIQGLKMLLHLPDETPQMTKNFFHLSMDANVMVAIKPDVMTTSERLRSYEPNRRQCYFQSERYLKFYRSYRQRNCELECLTNYTLQRCGCVKFSMPRADGTPVCGAARMQCYNEAEDELQRAEFVQGLATPRPPVDATRLSAEQEANSAGCNCLPDCTSITYDAEMSQTLFSWTEVYKAHKKPLAKIAGKHPSGLTLFFKEKQFISSQRTELYGLTDFLANCGGLIGLFMGVSILSIVEIVYYCTLRLMCNMKGHRLRIRRESMYPQQALATLAEGAERRHVVADGDETVVSLDMAEMR